MKSNFNEISRLRMAAITDIRWFRVFASPMSRWWVERMRRLASFILPYRSPKTGKRRNLGTFPTRAAAEKHERAVQYFKRH
jgi:hypothetical protein